MAVHVNKQTGAADIFQHEPQTPFFHQEGWSEFQILP